MERRCTRKVDGLGNVGQGARVCSTMLASRSGESMDRVDLRSQLVAMQACFGAMNGQLKKSAKSESGCLRCRGEKPGRRRDRICITAMMQL